MTVIGDLIALVKRFLLKDRKNIGKSFKPRWGIFVILLLIRMGNLKFSYLKILSYLKSSRVELFLASFFNNLCNFTNFVLSFINSSNENIQKKSEKTFLTFPVLVMFSIVVD